MQHFHHLMNEPACQTASVCQLNKTFKSPLFFAEKFGRSMALPSIPLKNDKMKVSLIHSFI